MLATVPVTPVESPAFSNPFTSNLRQNQFTLL
jgi:hypothetical protein